MKMHYVKKTLRDVLTEHPEYKHVLLKFFHGLGDAIDFYANCLPALEKAFPDRRFYVETQLGQELFFGKVNPDESVYDLAVFIVFPCAEWDDGQETKAEKCGRVELGVEIVPDTPCRYWITAGRSPSPLIGVHFVSTSNNDLCCPEETARLIWDKIAARGLIPIDTHFRHQGATIDRETFAWEKRNVENVPASVETLFGLIESLGGFVGVASGNFWAALCSLPPSKILYIETEFPVRKLTHIPIRNLNAKDPDEKLIDEWLDDCMEGRI